MKDKLALFSFEEYQPLVKNIEEVLRISQNNSFVSLARQSPHSPRPRLDLCSRGGVPLNKVKAWQDRYD
jgi:hypothetical protein